MKLIFMRRLNMKFGFPNIHVKDLEESKKFYQDLIKLNVRNEIQVGENIRIAFMVDTEANVLELIEDKSKLNEINYNKSYKVSLLFKVDDINEEMERATKAGFKFDGPLITTPSGTKFFYVIDPNGVPIQITSL